MTCADDAGTRDLAGQARALGLRVVSYGESADADYRIAGVTTSGMETSFHLAGRSRAVPGQSRPGPFGKIDLDLQLRVPGPPQRAERGRRPGRRRGARDRARRGPRRPWPATAAPRDGSSPRARPAVSGSSTPTPTTRSSSPPTCARPARSRDGAGGRVIAVFQPHLFSRTRIFAAEFGAALGLADEAVVLDVYAAREDPEPGVTGRLVADAVPGGAARYVPDLADVPAVVAALARPGDLVLTMGAGDITKMGPLVLDEIAASGADRQDRAAARRRRASARPARPAAPARRAGRAVVARRRRRGPAGTTPRPVAGGSSRWPWSPWSPGWPGCCSATGCSSSGRSR